MKKKFLVIFLIVFAVLVVSADSGEYHWYMASTGTTVDAFPDVGGNSSNTSDPGEPAGGDWLFFTKEGYDLRGSITIKGNIAILETITLNIRGNAYDFEGDIIIKNLIGYTVDEVDAQNDGNVIIENFNVPGCLFQNNPGDVINESYNTIHYAGNQNIEGMLYAPNTTEIRLGGTINIKGGICAPNAEVIITGNVNVSKFMLVRFLSMNGNPDFTLE